jgi:hypothetical protein
VVGFVVVGSVVVGSVVVGSVAVGTVVVGSTVVGGLVVGGVIVGGELVGPPSHIEGSKKDTQAPLTQPQEGHPPFSAHVAPPPIPPPAVGVQI